MHFFTPRLELDTAPTVPLAANFPLIVGSENDCADVAVIRGLTALMMSLNRKTHRTHARARDGGFSLNGLVGFDMHGRTAGVIGTGRIGSCLPSIRHGFGCDLLAYSRTPTPHLTDEYDVRFVEFDEPLAQSDIISLRAPLGRGHIT